jgi:hypothetical protein
LGKGWAVVAGGVVRGSDHWRMAVEQHLDTWLAELESRKGSDILLMAGSAPRLRVDGRLEPLAGAPALSSDEIEAIALAQLGPGGAKDALGPGLELDFSFSCPRRSAVAASPVDTAEGIVVDELSREVRVDGRLVALTAKEFDLLAFLARSPRQVFTRGQLLEHVWSSRSGWQDEATVTEHVRRLRHKVEKDPEHPRWLKTVRGVGYRFEP